MKMKVMNLEEAADIARNLAREKLTQGKNADEFVRIGEADGFKLYVAAGKTISIRPFQLMKILVMFLCCFSKERGELVLENHKKVTIRKGQYFVLPKHTKHHCFFKDLTVALEGVYEKGL